MAGTDGSRKGSDPGHHLVALCLVVEEIRVAVKLEHGEVCGEARAGCGFGHEPVVVAPAEGAEVLDRDVRLLGAIPGLEALQADLGVRFDVKYAVPSFVRS